MGNRLRAVDSLAVGPGEAPQHLARVGGHAQIKENLGFISLLIAEIWMSTPFMVIILEAGILSLPQEPFEAADIDGAFIEEQGHRRALDKPTVQDSQFVWPHGLVRAHPCATILRRGSRGIPDFRWRSSWSSRGSRACA